MLLYFSSEKNVDIFDKQAEELGIHIDLVLERDFTGYIETNKIKLNHLEFLAIDLENIIDEEIQLINSLSSFRLCNSNVSIIIVGFNREKGDSLLGRFFAEGIYNFVTSKDEDVRNIEIKSCFEKTNNYANTLGYRVEKFEISQNNNKNSIFSNFIENIKKSKSEKIYKKHNFNKKHNKNIHFDFVEDAKVINYNNKFIGIVEDGFSVIDNEFKIDEVKQFCKYNNLEYIFKDKICERLKSLSNKTTKIIEVEKIIEKKVVIKPKINKIKVAVCGICPRMGTTTQAFLICNYFKKYDFNVCYIEVNKNNSIKNLKNFYPIILDEENKKITYDEIDIFYNSSFEDFPKILTMDYEVFIFDYGEFLKTSEESFASADFRIVVSGAKAWEEKYIQNVFRICHIYNDINFIFSFVDEDEKDFIIKNMEELKVYFSDYAPNIFKFANEKIYNEIFKDYITFNELRG